MRQSLEPNGRPCRLLGRPVQKEGLNSFGVLDREETTSDMGIKGKEPSIWWVLQPGMSELGLGGCQACPEDSLHPERPSADSGRQGPFPNAGGSYHPFFSRKAPLWGSAFTYPEASPGLGRGQTGRGDKQALPGQGQSKPKHCGVEGEKCSLGTSPGRPPNPSLPTVVPESPPWASGLSPPLPHSGEPADWI